MFKDFEHGRFDSIILYILYIELLKTVIFKITSLNAEDVKNIKAGGVEQQKTTPFWEVGTKSHKIRQSKNVTLQILLGLIYAVALR